MIPNPKKIKAIAFALFAIILALMPHMNAAIIQKQIANQNSNNTLSDRDRVWNVSIEAARFYPIFVLAMATGNTSSVGSPLGW